MLHSVSQDAHQCPTCPDGKVEDEEMEMFAGDTKFATAVDANTLLCITTAKWPISADTLEKVPCH